MTNDKALEAALLPCPFCGGGSVSVHGPRGSMGAWVACTSCGLETPTETGVTTEQAFAYWNRRVPVSALPGEAEVVAWPAPKIASPDIPNPTGEPYLDCLVHRLLDAQQDINLAANESMSQTLADVSVLMDEIEQALRIAARSSASFQAMQARAEAAKALVEQAFRDGLAYGSNTENADPDVAWEHSRVRKAMQEGK